MNVNLLSLNAMYPYHNRIKQRIANKELVGYEYVDRYKNIAPCLLLKFSTEPKLRPIREHRFAQYEEILKDAFPSKKNTT